MTLLTVVQEVCAAVGVGGVAPITSVFASIGSNRTMMEMVALANEMARRIAHDTRDWTKLRAVQTYTGDGHWAPPRPDPLAVWTGTTAFNLPTNYQRMLLTANVWRSTSAITPMRFIPDTDEWLNRRAQNIYDAYGEWTMMGGQMLIQPIMAGPIVNPDSTITPAQSAYFAYLDKNAITPALGGTRIDTFMQDGDSFYLGDRLLKLGMIWQWKAQKGSPYAEDLGTYGDAISMAQGHDSPAPIIIGRKPISAATRTAYPWPVPTP